MFFSTNSSTKNGHDPFSFPPDHSFHLPISFFPFPSPFEFDQFDDDLFHQPDHNFTSNSQNNNIAPITTPTLDKIPSNTNTNTNTNTCSMAINNSDQKKKIPRKRLSKKDRHSKITTARGLRDRRMRLSLPVARQFFGLQDMLGVDKGSKTVEWLLIQARPEILKLAKERNCSLIMNSFKSSAVCSNSNSEGDMVSGIDEVGVIGGEENGENFVKKMKSLKSDGKKKKRVKQPRKTLAKEMREMARARARARTMEKKNQIRDCSVSDFENHDHHQNYNNNNNNFTKISSCSWSSPFETGEESGGTHSYNLNPAIEVEKPMTSQLGSSQSQPIIDYQFQNFSSFEIMAKWSPSDSTFNYLHQTENLDLQEQNEFEDSGIFG